MIRLLASLAALALGGIAQADEAALAEFRAAVEMAQAHAQDRYAFTLDFRDLGDKAERNFRVRFDPRKPAGARWSAIDPPQDQYGKEEKAAFARMTKNDEADDALVYEGLAGALEGATVISADAARATFAISINDPDMPQETKAALAATAVLDRKSGHVETVEIRSTRPFKPAAVAKISSMRQLQRYAVLTPGGPALMVASESDAEGSAMFKSFSSKARLAYSEIEKVDAPPRPRKKKG
jgi:hypothetical protein